MDMGNSGVGALCHGAFAMEACRTSCHSVCRNFFRLAACSLRPTSGTARLIASARNLEKVHMSKAQVYRPTPGTGSPRSG